MDHYSIFLGCLLGTALGDACGLAREGLSPRRAKRLFGTQPVEPRLAWGLGLCSDDTEHTLMVARALASSGGDVVKFQRQFARDLRCWLLTVPAGVGFATLRACLKLLIGFGPATSGVWSAGNGPAMRSAVIGLMAKDEEHLNELVHVSTRITHTDPRAAEGARLVARAARKSLTNPDLPVLEFLAIETEQIAGDELRMTMRAAIASLRDQHSCQAFAESQGWSNGVSGYVNQTVPAALYCWATTPHDFRECIQNAVSLGGDTDSVAAITGAVCGANLGVKGIPQEWIAKLSEWPRTVRWLERMAEALTDSLSEVTPVNVPSMHWLATLPRNFVFATIVLGMGLRRLLPPY